MEIQEVKSFGAATGLFCTGLSLCKYLKIERLSFFNQSSYLKVVVITAAACAIFKLFDQWMSQRFGLELHTNDQWQKGGQRAYEAGKNAGKVELITDLFKDDTWIAFNQGFNDLKKRTEGSALVVKEAAIRNYLQDLPKK